MPALRVQNVNLPFYPSATELQSDRGPMALNNYFKNLTLQITPWTQSVVNAINTGLVPVQAVSATFRVGVSATGSIVVMAPTVPAGIGYVVTMQPTWDSGGYWVTPSNNTSFTLNWKNPTPATTTFGLVIALDALPV